MSSHTKRLTATTFLAASVFLVSCSATPTGYDNSQAKIDTVMERAAEQARTSGQTDKSLALLEQIYKRNSEKPDAALNYAHALRKQGYYNRASLVLKPFATSSDLENGEIATEYAAILSAMGNYVGAENASRQAVLLAPQSGQAYHMLGIALDAQGHHEQAHVAFEKGLDYWEGDPSPILNNIGLNLAAQGFLDEAIETLRKALDTAPDREEIERNLRIVSALQYQPPKSGTRLVPPPPRKPATPEMAAKSKDAAEAVKLKGALDSLIVEPVSDDAAATEKSGEE